MSVGRVDRHLKLSRYTQRTLTAASVYLSAAIEYLVAEVNRISGNLVKPNKRKTITPRHIRLGVWNDAELNELLKYVHISHGGVLPCIHPSLLKRKSVSGQVQNRTGGLTPRPVPDKASLVDLKQVASIAPWCNCSIYMAFLLTTPPLSTSYPKIPYLTPSVYLLKRFFRRILNYCKHYIFRIRYITIAIPPVCVILFRQQCKGLFPISL
ncbi:unnamed protein product [Dibothriocephalus latus]|uniref:Histone H2A n=1 Tax=Dibothriocephalus latus TaxID=60516 RepID=A0A3P7PCK9_DIBLA|nr:unnamed protein product [Dibothriocephalus latus]